MNRRFFLEAVGALAIGHLLTSCGSTPESLVKVHILRRSLPIQLLKNAQRSLSPAIPVSISAQRTVAELFELLQVWNLTEAQSKTDANADTVTDSDPVLPHEIRLVGLGDYWLYQAIRRQLIEPIDLSESTLESLPSFWRTLVQRDNQGNPSATGQIWGAPYRWGATMLVYRKDKLKQLGLALTDWSDLWRPELKQRVGLLNHPREVIGMTLKTLGQSYNDINPGQQPELVDKLRSLHQQTLTYNSKDYIQPLILGDVWVAMGWSSDIIPALLQDDQLGVVFPASGSAVWADLWVKSKSPEKDQSSDFPEKQFLAQWIKYWWQEEVAEDITKFTDAASIIPTQAEIRSRHLSQKDLTEANLSRSEFLLPLTSAALDQYQTLWQTMRADSPVARLS